MDEIELLRNHQKILEGRIKDLENTVILQYNLLTVHSQTILKYDEQIKKLIENLCEIQKTINVLIADHNKKYDEKLDEVTDIVVSKHKYKM